MKLFLNHPWSVKQQQVLLQFKLVKTLINLRKNEIPEGAHFNLTQLYQACILQSQIGNKMKRAIVKSIYRGVENNVRDKKSDKFSIQSSISSSKYLLVSMQEGHGMIPAQPTLSQCFTSICQHIHSFHPKNQRNSLKIEKKIELNCICSQTLFRTLPYSKFSINSAKSSKN